MSVLTAIESATEPFVRPIKIISTLLISGAIALWVWQLITPLPPALRPVFWLTQIALVAHALEAAIALGLQIASPATHPPLTLLKTALFVFFTGTVGLRDVIQQTRPTAHPTTHTES